MQLRALLLDIGGVLLRLHPERVFALWSQGSGVPVDVIAKRWRIDDAYKAYEVGEIDFDEYRLLLSKRLGIDMDHETWRKGWNALVGTPFTEVMNRITAIARDFPCYCLTNSNPEHEATFRAAHGEHFTIFRHVFNSSTIRYRKPDERAYIHVVKHIGVAPGEILFIDDNADNVRGATSAGLRAVHVQGPDQTLNALDTWFT